MIHATIVNNRGFLSETVSKSLRLLEVANIGFVRLLTTCRSSAKQYSLV